MFNIENQSLEGSDSIPEQMIDLLDRSDNCIVVLLCTAEWVGGSDMFLNFIQKEISKKAAFVFDIDTDQHPDLRKFLFVERLPTTIVLYQRQVIDRIEGVIPRRKIRERIKSWEI
ncbi:MAG: thioredoxin family protein [Bacteroidota bacterium]